MNAAPTGREMADIAVSAGAIDMAQGVVHSPPPLIFQKKLSELLGERRLHMYASPAGYLPYREALLAVLREQRPSLLIENIMATNGVTGGLVSALRSACKPGEAVALFEPFYPAHAWAIESLHLEVEYMPYAKDFSIDLDQIATTLEMEHVSVLVLGNPANPTGTVIPQPSLEEIVRLCAEHDVLLIIDEVYRDFIWEGEFASPLTFASSLENIVILRSFSKNLALAGWRAGYAIASPERLERMKHVHEAFYVGAPAPAQFVLAQLLGDPNSRLREFVQELVELYRVNRQVVTKAFTEYGMEPIPKGGAYYMLVKHRRESDIAAMQELLKRGIAVAPGVPFYRPGTKDTGYIRIHFALSATQIEEFKRKLI